MSETTLPKNWTRARLRFDVETNPVKSQISLPGDADVSFVPMDAVGEYGGLRLDETRQLSEVYNGFTYFCDGDICIAKITPCFENGKGAIAAGLTNGVGFGTTELHVVRPSTKVDRRFLFYITIAHDFRSIGAAEMLGAGGQKRVPERFIKDWRAPLPPITTQKRIAAFLDEKTARIDALLAKKQALLERLAEKRQAIITQAVTKGINPDASMKDSGIDWLGRVPADWSVEVVGRSIHRVEQGWSPQCEERLKAEGEWGVLRSGCVNGGIFRPHDHKTLPADLEPRPGLEVRAGDLLFCRASGSIELIGSAAVVESCPTQLMFSDKTYRIRTVLSRLDTRFLALALQSQYMRAQFKLSVSGAEGLANNIPQSKLKQYWIARPSVDEQRHILTELQPRFAALDETTQVTERSISLLLEFRSTLITNAVNGQIEELQ